MSGPELGGGDATPARYGFFSAACLWISSGLAVIVLAVVAGRAGAWSGVLFEDFVPPSSVFAGLAPLIFLAIAAMLAWGELRSPIGRVAILLNVLAAVAWLAAAAASWLMLR